MHGSQKERHVATSRGALGQFAYAAYKTATHGRGVC